MNWKRIIAFAALLFVAEVLVGFIAGGFSGTDVTAFRRRLAVSVCLSLALSGAVFSAMSYRQAHRPFLHALSALLLMAVLSLALAAAFPALLGSTPIVLIALDWVTLAVALIIGTSFGRYLAGPHHGARTGA